MQAKSVIAWNGSRDAIVSPTTTGIVISSIISLVRSSMVTLSSSSLFYAPSKWATLASLVMMCALRWIHLDLQSQTLCQCHGRGPSNYPVERATRRETYRSRNARSKIWLWCSFLKGTYYRIQCRTAIIRHDVRKYNARMGGRRRACTVVGLDHIEGNRRQKLWTRISIVFGGFCILTLVYWEYYKNI